MDSLRPSVGKLQVCLPHSSVKFQILRFKSPFRSGSYARRIARARAKKTLLWIQVQKNCFIRLNNAQYLRYFLNLGKRYSAGCALIGTSGILIAIRKYDEPALQRRFNDLLQMLIPICHIKQQLAPWFSAAAIRAKQHLPEGQPKIRSTRLSCQKTCQTLLLQIGLSAVYLQALAGTFNSFKCYEHRDPCQP
jgi:hypothetical protein